MRFIKHVSLSAFVMEKKKISSYIFFQGGDTERGFSPSPAHWVWTCGRYNCSFFLDSYNTWTYVPTLVSKTCVFPSGPGHQLFQKVQGHGERGAAVELHT